MKNREVNLPQLGLIAATRVMLGIGIGLLVSGRFSPEMRRRRGWTLLAIGALSTVPLALSVLRHDEPIVRHELAA